MIRAYYISPTCQATANLVRARDDADLRQQGFIQVGLLAWLIWSFLLERNKIEPDLEYYRKYPMKGSAPP